MIKQTRGSLRSDCLYFQTGHGKNPCDFVGARQRDLPIWQLYREVMQEHMHYATVVTQKTTNLTFCHIPSSDGSKGRNGCAISRMTTCYGEVGHPSSPSMFHGITHAASTPQTTHSLEVVQDGRKQVECPSEDKAESELSSCSTGRQHSRGHGQSRKR